MVTHPKAEWVLPQLPQAKPPLKQRPSIQRCQKCQRSHHTWLHLNKEASPQRQTNTSPSMSENTPDNVTSHLSQLSDHHHQVSLATYQVRVIAPDGSTTIARALLDLGSSTCTCFVTECLVQHLYLLCQYCHMQISSDWQHYCAFRFAQSSQWVGNFKASPTTRHGKVIAVEAVVLPKVTTDVPSTTVSFNNN